MIGTFSHYNRIQRINKAIFKMVKDDDTVIKWVPLLHIDGSSCRITADIIIKGIQRAGQHDRGRVEGLAGEQWVHRRRLGQRWWVWRDHWSREVSCLLRNGFWGQVRRSGIKRSAKRRNTAAVRSSRFWRRTRRRIQASMIRTTSITCVG